MRHLRKVFLKWCIECAVGTDYGASVPPAVLLRKIIIFAVERVCVYTRAAGGGTLRNILGPAFGDLRIPVWHEDR